MNHSTRPVDFDLRTCGGIKFPKTHLLPSRRKKVIPKEDPGVNFCKDKKKHLLEKINPFRFHITQSHFFFFEDLMTVGFFQKW